jgi:uncharacterized membrane protein YbhN (UPF0104 family)
MKINFLTIFKYLVSLVIAVGIFAYLYQGQDIGKMFSDLLSVKFEWVLLSFMLSLLSHFCRAWRWSIMLKLLGYDVGYFRPFLAVMAAYFANFILPRMGEVTRCTVMQRTDNVPFQKSFGAVIAERAFDLVCLILVTLAAVLLEFDKLESLLNEVFASDKTGNESGNHLKFILGAMILLGGMGALVIWVVFKEKIKKLGIYQKIIEIFMGVKEGFISVLKLKSREKNLFFANTVVIWLCYFFTGYVLFLALPETAHLSLGCGLSNLAMSGVAIVAPVQGGIGVYHYLISKTLMVYGIAEVSAKYFAFMAHNSQTVLLIGVGSICLIISLLIRKKGSQV